MSLPPDDVVRRRVKVELRKRMRALRKAAPLASCAERSEQICARLEALPPVAAAASVALFWPIEARHEVDLRALGSRLRGRGAKIAYPAVDPTSGLMTFRWADDADLVQRGLGFAEPHASAPEAAPLDVIVVPALAVDPRGHRLGYGAGYYDRTLPRFAPPAIAVAVAYDYQLVAELPVTEADVRVAWVVTDARTIEARDT
jgi:5-formyltetrahydrofolate cyclo-ligase